MAAFLIERAVEANQSVQSSSAWSRRSITSIIIAAVVGVIVFVRTQSYNTEDVMTFAQSYKESSEPATMNPKNAPNRAVEISIAVALVAVLSISGYFIVRLLKKKQQKKIAVMV